jgi:RNA polymerase sigma factor (sigma-70 family)
MHETPTGQHDLRSIGYDPAAFEHFYRTHVDALGRFISRRIDDPYTVADLTAEVFLAAVESAHTYRADRGSEVGWLFGVARNVVAAERRRALRELNAGKRVSGHRVLDSEDIVRLEERIDAEAAARSIYSALAGMDDHTGELIELVAVDGLSITEAAAALGMSAIRARVRLHRARKVLRALLSQPHPTSALSGGTDEHIPQPAC